MKVLNNTQKISETYRQWQPNSSAGEPAAENMKPSAIMPVDRVSLSTRTFREEGGQPASDSPVVSKKELSVEDRQTVDKLKQRDAEVKAHEQAHMASGGDLVQGSASYEFQSGPDGKMYAVGGEVQIDTSAERTPEATISKMQQVRQAALAPAQPSGTDRAVAAQASQIEAQARMELIQKNKEAKNEKQPAFDIPSQYTMTGQVVESAAQPLQAMRGHQIDVTI